MGRNMTRMIGSVLAVWLWLLPSVAASATVTVDCDTGGTIGAALGGLRPGDMLVVSGTCREHVVIPAEAARITLDGQGKATIQGAGPAADTVFVSGRNITIKGFTLTGGRDGIHLSGPGAVVIDGNIIQNNGRGIHLDKGSIGRIINNTIQNNRGVGINIIENSYARIGFFIPPEPTLRPNTIRNNQGHGIHVGRASSAWIIGNTIADNKGTGIVVNRSSQADIAGNTINGNSGDALSVSHNSGVNLKSEGTSRREGPNHTDPALKNNGVAVRCSVGGYVDGPLGALAGSQGVKEFDNGCVDRVSLQ